MEDINEGIPIKKKTDLQNKLGNLFENHKEGFGQNIFLLKEMTYIAQNRGYSHKKRIEKINEIMTSASNFNEQEKDYVNKLLRVEKKYLENKQAIKNKEGIYEDIYNLRKGILESLIEEQEQEIEAISHPVEIIELNYDFKEEPTTARSARRTFQPLKEAIYNTTFASRHPYKRTGWVLTAGVVALGAAAILGVSSFFLGSYSQKPKIEQKNAAITKQEREIEKLRSSIEETKRSVYDLNNAFLGKYNAQKTEADILNTKLNEMKQDYSSVLSNIDERMTKLEGKISSNTATLEKMQKEKQTKNEEWTTAQNKRSHELEGGRIDENLKVLEQKIDELSSQIGNMKGPETKIEIKVGKNNPEFKGQKELEEPEVFSERRYDENPIPTLPPIETTSGIQKQQYLKDKLFDYPKELDYKSKMQWKQKKPIASILTRVGWVFSVANDIVEVPVNLVGRPVGAVVGSGVGAVTEVLTPGYTNEIAKASKTGYNFPPYLMDGLPGGRSNNAFHGRLLHLKPVEAFKVGYESETTEAGALLKDGIIIGSDIVPFLLGHHRGHEASAAPSNNCPPAVDPAVPDGFWIEP
jgi:hypothetical protein